MGADISTTHYGRGGAPLRHFTRDGSCASFEDTGKRNLQAGRYAGFDAAAIGSLPMQIAPMAR